MKPYLPADDILRDNEAHCRGDVTTTLPTRRLRALGTTGKRQPSVVVASRWRLARPMLTGFMRRPGVALALTSVWLGIMWMAATKPLNAPDESAHLQAIMQIRKEGILPEIHFDPGNPVSETVGTRWRPGIPRQFSFAGPQRPLYAQPIRVVAATSFLPGSRHTG